jgi:PAS domain S-box-containing protein
MTITSDPKKPQGRFLQSLHGKLVLILLVLIIPTFLIQVYIYHDRFEMRRSEELQTNLEVARATAKTFDAYIQDILNDELLLGLAFTASQPMSAADIKGLLQSAHSALKAVRDLSWVGPEGTFIYSSNPGMIGANHNDQTYFREIADGCEWAVGDLVIARTTGEPVFSVARGFRKDKGDLVGVVVATIIPGQLDRVLGIERFEDAGINVLDRKGRLVFRHPVIDYTWEQRDWLKAYPMIKDALEAKEIVATVVSNYYGTKRLVGFTPISIGWVAGAGRTESVATAAIRTWLLPQTIAFLLITVAAFAIALFFSSKISTTIGILRDHALAFGRGENQNPVAMSGTAEFDDLANALNKMTEDIRSRQSERNRAEEALRESEERLRLLGDNLPESAVYQYLHEIGSSVHFLHVSAGIERLNGVSVQDVLRDAGTLHRQISPEYFEQVKEAEERSAREMSDFDMEVPMRRPDGQVRWMRLHSRPRRMPDGRIIWDGVQTDVTERKRMEQELRENQSRLDLALRSSQMGVWHLDIDEDRRVFDDQVCHLLGIDPARFTGTAKEFFDAVHPDDHDRVRAALVRTIEHGVPYETEYRAIWPDGGVHHITARGNLARDKNGRPVRINGLIWDITEHKRMEEEQLHLFELARQRNAETEAVFEAINDAVLIYDTNMNVQRVNSMFIPTYGFDPVNLNVREIIQRTQCRWPDGRPFRFEEQPTPRALRGETVLNQHFLITRPNGVEMALETSSGPLRSGDDITGTVTVWHDITERKQMEEDLRRSRDELELRVQERTTELNSYMAKLERSNQALQDFASIASHDMQEPLRKVISFGNMLRQKCGDSLEQSGNDYLNRMLDATERMQSLLTGLLEYSRVTTTTESFKEVDLSELISEVLSDLEVRIIKTGGEVHVGTLPVISADPTQMRQLFQNLIGNALKFHKQGEKPMVQVRSVCNTDSGCQIILEDNGIGFEEQYLDRIFAPFQRLHGRSEYEGTGMGLAICKKIVERHGGSITATSTPGKGTAFIINLPFSTVS